MTEPQHKRNRGEQGSALLVVLVFAAIIAIMLYRSLPNTLFEARRQKEQLLLDRGHEYQRAIQLYYRRNRGMYPPNIDALENTNGIRFLRQKFTDPFTGKDDWRLIHGQNGVLVDSKVNPLNTNTGQQQSSTQQGTSSQQASSATDSHAATPAAPPPEPGDVVVAPVKERGQPTPANPNDPNALPTSAELAQDPSVPLLPTQQPTDAATKTSAPATTPALTTGAATSATQAGVIAGGAGIAGVASKVKGKSIKQFKDQDDYSLWEFVYDPRTDTGSGGSTNGTQAAPAAGAQTGAQARAQTGAQPANATPQQTPAPTAQPPSTDPGSTPAVQGGGSAAVSPAAAGLVNAPNRSAHG